jgi:hypothetical protein
MRVRIAGRSSLPLWIQPDRIATSDYYYRCFLPALVTGGAVDVKVLVPADEVGVLARALVPGSTEEATLFALGTPTIFKFLGMRGPSMVELIAAINAAGGDAWIDADDDYFGLPPEQEVAARMPPNARLAIFGSAEVGAIAEWRARCIEDFGRALQVANGVIVSTTVLADIVRPHNPHVLVIPNMVDPAHFFHSIHPADGIVRIGYGASFLHGGADLELVLPALLQCARLPNTELHFWSVHPLSASSLEPGLYDLDGVSYHYHGSVSTLPEYQQAVSILDVAVAPQVDTANNRCRSHCKWLEHALNDTAMVVSDMPSYACVEHGVTGFKARTLDDFARYLSLLVTDAGLRKRIGRAARADVLRRHTPRALGPAVRDQLARMLALRQ